MPLYRSDKYKCFVCTIRKCGTSSFRSLFQNSPELEFVKQEDQNKWHDPDYSKCVIVRNPYDRMVSAWSKVRDEYYDRYNYSSLGFSKNVLEDSPQGFSAFLQESREIPDRHWRPQTEEIQAVADLPFEFDYVLKLENILESWSLFCCEIGLPDIAFPKVGTLPRNLQHYSNYYNQESIAEVLFRYRCDCATLGYSFSFSRYSSCSAKAAFTASLSSPIE